MFARNILALACFCVLSVFVSPTLTTLERSVTKNAWDGFNKERGALKLMNNSEHLTRIKNREPHKSVVVKLREFSALMLITRILVLSALISSLLR